MRYVAVPLDVRELPTGEKKGQFVGHASVFGVEDSYGTVFDEGSFLRTLKAQKGRVPITFFHMPWVGVGMANAREDSTGLLIDGRLNVERSANAAEVYAGLPDPSGENEAAGYYSQMSHGFDPIKVVSKEDSKDGRTHYREVKLYEVAIVMKNFAANPEADITEVRSKLLAMQMAMAGGSSLDIGRMAVELRETMEEHARGATSYGNLPLGDRDREWDAAAATKRIRRWADAEDEPNAKYRRGFMWYDDADPEKFGSYKLPFADSVDGELQAIPRGLFAVAGRLDSAEIPEADRGAVRAHVSKYYAKMRREWGDDNLYPPWERADDGLLVIRSSKTIQHLADAIEGLNALLGSRTADPRTRTAAGGWDPQLHSRLMAELSRAADGVRSIITTGR